MKIVDVVVESFRSKSRGSRDSHGHGHPGPERDSTQSLLKIITDDGAAGYNLGGLGRDVLEGIVKPVIVGEDPDRKSTRLNSSHLVISYAVFCLKKKNIITH